MRCTVFVDESGEAGIAKVRTESTNGAPPYFVLGAAVLPNAVCIQAKQLLDEFDSKIPKASWSHATNLDHAEKVLLCRMVSKLNLRFFVTISNKATLQGYAEDIRNDPQKYYNKCAAYLLEQVGGYTLAKGISPDHVDVVFEARNHNYDRMRRFLGKIKSNPMHTNALNLTGINPFSIIAKKKADEPLLKLADLVSHAAYQCVNKSQSNFEIPEPRYLAELSGRLGADRVGNVLGIGLKCIHSIDEIEFDSDVRSLIESFRATPLTRHN